MQLGLQLPFQQKSPAKIFSCNQVWVEDLDGMRTAQHPVGGVEDFGHSAFTDQFNDLVMLANDISCLHTVPLRASEWVCRGVPLWASAVSGNASGMVESACG